jgi:drug/metabolite transporter (DMT)-like permease
MPPFAVAIVFLSTFMHTGWNLIARDLRGTDILLRSLMIVSLLGLTPVALAEFLTVPILPSIWHYLLIAGMFQGVYFVGLSLGYRTGDFSVVYPLARGLPALLVALTDLVRGQAPSPLGWVGIVLVSAGCTFIPLESWRGVKMSHYLNRALLWTLLTAVATAGYSVADSAASKLMPSGAPAALRYGLFEMFLSFVFYWIFLRSLRLPASTGQSATWPRSIAVGILLFGAYGLVLWAYQLSTNASYVVAMRQFSIVIGVVTGSLLFQERAREMRIASALVITLGGVCIALAR